jgi:hypothetical protein
MGPPPLPAEFASIAAVLPPMPRVSLTAGLGARIAHLVSRRRLYVIMLCGHFSLGLALT